MKNMLLDFIERNKPIFYIGGLTAVLFFVLILLAHGQETVGPKLIQVTEENFISDHTPVSGSDEAKVLVVEFSDLECPNCADNHAILKELQKKYPGDIQVAFRHFPLDQHKNAKDAAIAAQAAYRQGKFWEYISKVYENKGILSEDKLVAAAKDIGLDMEKFAEDRKNAALDSQVREDISFAERLGIAAVPTFYVNGKVIDTNLESEVKKEIQRINPKIETTQETSPSVESVQTQELDDKYGILEIRYTNNGFTPVNTKAVPGQLIRFSNNSSGNIILEQRNYLFKDMPKAVEIEVDGYFEFRVGKVGMKDVIWTYIEKVSGNIGSTLIISEKDSTTKN